MAQMTISDIKKFLMKDTFTGKLATVKINESPHVVPIWFVVEVNSRNKIKQKTSILQPAESQSRQKIFNVIVE